MTICWSLIIFICGHLICCIEDKDSTVVLTYKFITFFIDWSNNALLSFLDLLSCFHIFSWPEAALLGNHHLAYIFLKVHILSTPGALVFFVLAAEAIAFSSNDGGSICIFESTMFSFHFSSK